ncbi:alpha/beta fold hydrolase [Arthrobacter sp. ISL-28]|uniref:alpha/beta fold hydrolase n=1 Tax=Arthrobacter sp. ISL-28 TaxID=2819108 RepID=UPI001BE6CC22|nr:alpha/beta hydrolase [Arthrobacter sp. ISL-28]MBT2523804.1 alpha/beta hydrolase [Arthrobacter sp. ISL-28]
MSNDHNKAPRTKIVFVHGFLDDRSAWDDVLSRLGEDFEAVALDLPGSGAHLNDEGPFTLRRLAESVIAEIDRSDKPVVLVGQSMGAQLSELAAASRPEKVAALVLLTPVPLAGVHLTGDAANSFRSLGGDADAQRQGRLGVSVSLTPRALEILVASGTAIQPTVVAQVFDAWNNGEAAGATPSAYAGPTLIMRGVGDPFVTEEVIGAAVLPRFANAPLVGIADAGHFPHLEKPEEVSRIVGDFARSLDRI